MSHSITLDTRQQAVLILCGTKSYKPMHQQGPTIDQMVTVARMLEQNGLLRTVKGGFVLTDLGAGACKALIAHGLQQATVEVVV